MEALPPILIGVVVAAVVAVGVRRVLRRRRTGAGPEADFATRQRASDITFIVISVLLMVLSVIVGQRVLFVEPSPRDELYRAGVGFAPDVRAEPNRGFVVGLAAKFSDCDDPVDVTIVIAGTAEYFKDRAAFLKGRMGFTVAVPSRGLSRVTIGYGGYEDALKPTLAKMGDWLPVNPVKREASRKEPLEVTSIRGSIANWSSHLASLVVTFKADWLVARGLGTCYLKLPPLAGSYSVLGAQDGLGSATRKVDKLAEKFPQADDAISNDSDTLFAWYERSLAIRRGVSVVETGESEVLKFEPAANTFAAGLPAIACFQSSLNPGDLSSHGTDLVRAPGAYGDYAIRDRVFSEQVGGLDCGALVTLAEAGAGNQRDLVLLLVGAFFSLGAAALLEIGLDMLRRWFAKTTAA